MVEHRFLQMFREVLTHGWMLKFEGFTCVVCHPTWVSSDTAQSISLPKFEAESFPELCEQLYKYFYSGLEN
jgi:hypothetical protein